MTPLNEPYSPFDSDRSPMFSQRQHKLTPSDPTTKKILFFVGLHQPHDAAHFERCMVSINRLRRRKSAFPASQWMLDSGAFTELKDHGCYRHSVKEYAEQVLHWCSVGGFQCAVSQDYMCEPFILARTGLTTAEHQRLTIERYDVLLQCVGPRVPILPVIQGYAPKEYLAHLDQYGDRLAEGQWVGIGSVCKRNARIDDIEQVLSAVHRARPDLRLHGFGVKTTALASSIVRECLYSADSLAWSRWGRWNNRDRNHWTTAKEFEEKIHSQPVKYRVFQGRLFS